MRRSGAAPGCPSCGGWGWGPGPAFAACGCVPTCAGCGGGGFVHGGLEPCACRVATERVALLRSARLPWTPDPAPLPPAAAAWFARCRPEDGAPWLTVAGAGPGAVAAGLARLVCAAGIPVDTDRDPARWRRVVAVLDGDALDEATAERLVDACAARGTTLVFACARAPFADGGGVERTIGDRVAAALWDRGLVVAGP